MKKIETEIWQHDRAFEAGEEIRFILDKTKEMLEAGRVGIASYGGPEPGEVVTRTDNYVLRISRIKDDNQKREAREES